MWSNPIPDPDDVTIQVLNGTVVQTAYQPGQTYDIRIQNTRPWTNAFDDVTHGSIAAHGGVDPSQGQTPCPSTKWHQSRSDSYTYTWQAPELSETVLISHFSASSQGNAVLKQLRIGVLVSEFVATNGTVVTDNNEAAKLSRALYIPFMASMLHMLYRTDVFKRKLLIVFSAAYIACLVAYQFTDSVETTPSFANDDGFVYYVFPGAVILAVLVVYAIYGRSWRRRALTAFFGLSLTTLPMNHVWHIKYGEQPDQRPIVLAYWAMTLALFSAIGYYAPDNNEEGKLSIYGNYLSRWELGFVGVGVVLGIALGSSGHWAAVHITELVVTSACVVSWVSKIVYRDCHTRTTKGSRLIRTSSVQAAV